jgi:hypothetical protein
VADVKYTASAKIISAYGREIPVDNTVRLNNDGTGPRSVPDDVPYMPQGFPLSPPGGWQITGVFARTQDDRAPFYISTNAWRMVPEWTVDAAGKFLKPTGRWVHDAAYGIHFTIYDFTWGCIRVIEKTAQIWLAGQVTEEIVELAKIDPKQAWISMEAVA